MTLKPGRIPLSVCLSLALFTIVACSSDDDNGTQDLEDTSRDTQDAGTDPGDTGGDGSTTNCAGDGDCSTDQYCEGGVCIADVCFAEAYSCSGDVRRRCNSRGDGYEDSVQCDVSCANGECLSACAGDGDCSADHYCEGGSCIADICSAGAYSCSGDIRRPLQRTRRRL